MHIEDQPAPTPNNRPAIWDLVIADMKARDKLGRKRYGTPLQAFNGRDGLWDAMEEAMDLVVYLRQVITEREANEHLEVHQFRAARDEAWRDGEPPKNDGQLYEKRTLYAAPQPVAVPQGWAMEAVEDGIRLTAPDGERWRFRETDGSDLFVFKFLRAMLDAAPSPANHIPDAGKMVQAAQPRPWVGLSEAERVAIEEDNSLDTIGALFDAVESALRAKNEVK